MRALRLIIVLALVFGAAACSGNSASSTGSNTPGSSHASTAPAPPSGPAAATTVPTTPSRAGSLLPSDVSFVSTVRGWVIGQGRMLRTLNGGSSWTGLPAPPAGTNRVRFATTSIGYAWADLGPLWMTGDGSLSWRSGQLDRVDSLEIAGGLVWALAGEFPYPDVWRAPVGAITFSRVGHSPNRGDLLSVHGTTAFVLGPQGAGPVPSSLSVFADTAPVRNARLPCDSPTVYVPGAALGISTDGTVFLGCTRQPQSGPGTNQAYLSTAQARTWTPTPAPPEEDSGLAAVSGRLFAWGKNLSVQDGHGWHVTLPGPKSGKGFALVGFEDNTHGLALDNDGLLHLTRDAGRTWTAVSF